MNKSYDSGVPYPSFLFHKFQPELTNETNPLHEEYDHELYLKLLEKATPPTLSFAQINSYLENNEIVFDTDYYERKYEYLKDFIPGIRIYTAGGSIPFQASGVWGHYEFYYRERHGVAQLRVSQIGLFPSLQNSLWSSSIKVKEFRGGDGWVKTFLKLWETLEATPNLWEFLGQKIEYNFKENSYTILEEKQWYYSWGNTAEKAFEELFDSQTYLSQYGINPEIIKNSLKDALIIFETAITQKKTYPKEEPIFKVNY